ncbi:MAG: copper resistance protein CopC, partial [Actinobacteria bacterium]
MVGAGVVRCAGAAGRVQVVARRRREHPRDRRARRRRARARRRGDRALHRGREARGRVTLRLRTTLVLVAATGALALPAAAWAHAGLVRTVPRANVVLNQPPPVVQLTYTEAVEPRFAAISVTNAAGEQQTAGSPRRSAADPKTLVVPLKRVGEGWYLVYWRVISVDGHPVRGAFIFA